MATLAELVKKPTVKPPMLTIVGSPGTGKSSLAGLFPNPIFIQTEDAETVFESWEDDVKPSFLPKIIRSNFTNQTAPRRTSDHIKSQLRMILEDEHDFETLIIDSVTSLNTLFEDEVCKEYNVDNVGDAAGGFFKGFKVVSRMHADIKQFCEAIQKKRGMTIILLAHTGIERMKQSPDTDEYSFFTLDMYKDSVPVYTNLVDGVFYLKKEEFVSGVEKNKKNGQVTKYGKLIQTGDRILITNGDGKVGYINAKSRYPLETEIKIPQGENPLLELIPFFTKK